MYNPAHFREDRPEAILPFLRSHPLATLVTVGAAGLEASQVPLFHTPGPAPHGALRGHLARANPQWRDLRAGFDALAIFQGPQAYVSPRFYPSKQTDARVVPTWNYLVVHARGPLVIHQEAAWLREQVTELTRLQEAGAAAPWQVSDAPADYIDKLLGAIVGIELPIVSLEGKWKVSQNRPATDREEVARRLAPDQPELAEFIRRQLP